MESKQHRWVVGVQWHPERPEAHKPDFHPLQRKLFAAFIDQARASRPQADWWRPFPADVEG